MSPFLNEGTNHKAYLSEQPTKEAVKKSPVCIPCEKGVNWHSIGNCPVIVVRNVK